MSPNCGPSNLIWRWLLPIGAIAAMAIGLFVKEQMVNPHLPQVDSRRAAIPSKSSVDHAPTLAAYRKAVEKDASFDALLARDADRLLRGMPRQSLRKLLDESF